MEGPALAIQGKEASLSAFSIKQAEGRYGHTM